MGDEPPPGLPTLGPLTVAQLLKSEQKSELGRRLKSFVNVHPLKDVLGGINLRDDAQRDQFFLMCNQFFDQADQFFDQADQAAIQEICANGLPYFIRTELSNTAIFSDALRDFQKTFWTEIQDIWRNPTPAQEKWTRLLMVAATGTGKSNLIAMAPFAGARDRCLVLVPNLTILEGLRKTLGGPPPQGEEEAEETVPPALKKLVLLGDNAQMPRVLVLNDLKKGKNSQGNYVYPLGSGTPARPLCEIILEHEIVLSTTQTVVKEGKKKKKGKESAAEAADDEEGGDIELTAKGKLIEMHEWIKENKKPLFDLLCFDEAHHIYAYTWMLIMTHLGAQPSKPVEGLTVTPNTLLLTATPFHAQGNLEDRRVSDHKLTPCTLIDAREAEGGKGITKGVVFMEIQRNEGVQQTAMQNNLEVLRLVGDMLKEKMRVEPHLSHRALIIINNVERAKLLVEMYDSLPEDEKPAVRPGVKMVCAAYYGVKDPTEEAVMKERLSNFSWKEASSPVHCLVQCQKLGEGYDQPNISVAGICSKLGKVSKFAQFSGRAVRKQDHNNVEAALVEHISNKRDNIAHIITHSINDQRQHWRVFATQQGVGDFDPHGDDDDDDDFDDNATTASDEVALVQRKISDSFKPDPKKQKVEAAASSAETRLVHRYALARTTEKQDAVLEDEKKLYDTFLKDCTTRRWTVENKTTEGPGGAGPSNAA